MIQFAALYRKLDSTTKTNEKVAAMVEYFRVASDADAAWAIYFLSGSKLRRLVPTKLLRQWAAKEASIPDWLFEESYSTVGDLAETISLVVPPGQPTEDTTLDQWVRSKLTPLRAMEEHQQQSAIQSIWQQTTFQSRFVVMKLITGAFRVGVSKRLVVRAIAKYSGISADVVSHRLMGDWEPNADFYQRLIDPDVQESVISRPYPFCLAHPIDQSEKPETKLDGVEYYAAEWKWDGIRGQVIRRDGQTFLWSRGEELMENRWPEIESAAELLQDGTVLDGEILAAKEDGTILPFGELQRRIGRKRVGKKLLSEVPVCFYAFDLIEEAKQDIRMLPWEQRRRRLEKMLGGIAHAHLRVTEIVQGRSWRALTEIRATSRDRLSEGLMLKRKDAPYDVGRVRGTWWKWKIEPHTIDAVLIYAQKGHGKRANLFTDYTFAVWDGDTLVPFAKAYSGLDDREIRQVDSFVRQNTQEKFGPVRSVTPELVMELAFEGLQHSTRHKSGVATRFPRIARWRHDKKPADANTLDELKQLLPNKGDR